MKRKTFPITLQSSELIAPKVRHLRFLCDDEQPFDFIAGQFIMIHFTHDDKELNRSYSLANLPGKTNAIEFAASYVEHGPASELLFNLQPGERLNASGPFGRLILRDEEIKRYLLIATGTGVTPYLSMLKDIEKRIEKEGINVVVLYGTQGRETCLYGDQFADFAKSHTKFLYNACYSREFPEDCASHECKGHVQDQLEELNLNPETDIVYLCGNPDMIDDTFALLKEKGFTTASVRREKYVSPKTR